MRRYCGLVVSAPAWDGTGCEFDSWQCRIYIPCLLSLRLLGYLRGLWVHKNCVKKKDKRWRSLKQTPSEILSFFWSIIVALSCFSSAFRNKLYMFVHGGMDGHELQPAAGWLCEQPVQERRNLCRKSVWWLHVHMHVIVHRSKLSNTATRYDTIQVWFVTVCASYNAKWVTIILLISLSLFFENFIYNVTSFV